MQVAHRLKQVVCGAVLACAVTIPGISAAAEEVAARLESLAAGDHRSAENKARNDARHPVETLAFFGIRPDMTVVELWPSTGWYTEILAPFLRDEGRYIAAGFDRDADSDYLKKNLAAFDAKLKADPELYGRVEITELAPPDKVDIAPAGSADMVLTFRNLHNWMMRGQLETVIAAAHKALKPGGILGVVEHRADPNATPDAAAKSGYVSEAEAIRIIEAAGFELVEKSEVNANPRDTKDHEGGVWALPPTLRHGDKDREKYLAIGESDRMTLKFRKRQG